ncbi:VWA domain-containing protein [Nonomuraea thailandensis]
MARGALVIVLSDGLERGDCEPMRAAVRRLSLLSHRLLWWTPLACDPAYRPVTRGMSAVLADLDAIAGVRDLRTAYEQVQTMARE